MTRASKSENDGQMQVNRINSLREREVCVLLSRVQSIEHRVNGGLEGGVSGQ